MSFTQAKLPLEKELTAIVSALINKFKVKTEYRQDQIELLRALINHIQNLPKKTSDEEKSELLIGGLILVANIIHLIEYKGSSPQPWRMGSYLLWGSELWENIQAILEVIPKSCLPPEEQLVCIDQLLLLLKGNQFPPDFKSVEYTDSDLFLSYVDHVRQKIVADQANAMHALKHRPPASHIFLKEAQTIHEEYNQDVSQRSFIPSLWISSNRRQVLEIYDVFFRRILGVTSTTTNEKEIAAFEEKIQRLSPEDPRYFSIRALLYFMMMEVGTGKLYDLCKKALNIEDPEKDISRFQAISMYLVVCRLFNEEISYRETHGTMHPDWEKLPNADLLLLSFQSSMLIKSNMLMQHAITADQSLGIRIANFFKWAAEQAAETAATLTFSFALAYAFEATAIRVTAGTLGTTIAGPLGAAIAISAVKFAQRKTSEKLSESMRAKLLGKLTEFVSNTISSLTKSEAFLVKEKEEKVAVEQKIIPPKVMQKFFNEEKWIEAVLRLPQNCFPSKADYDDFRTRLHRIYPDLTIPEVKINLSPEIQEDYYSPSLVSPSAPSPSPDDKKGKSTPPPPTVPVTIGKGQVGKSDVSEAKYSPAGIQALVHTPGGGMFVPMSQLVEPSAPGLEEDWIEISKSNTQPSSKIVLVNH